MVFQSTIPTVVALRLRAGRAGVVGPGSYVAFASAGIAFLSSARRSSSRWRARAGCAAAGLLVGGVFYLVYLVARAALAVGEPASRRLG